VFVCSAGIPRMATKFKWRPCSNRLARGPPRSNANSPQTNTNPGRPLRRA
jgi:hypothetical protein